MRFSLAAPRVSSRLEYRRRASRLAGYDEKPKQRRQGPHASHQPRIAVTHFHSRSARGAPSISPRVVRLVQRSRRRSSSRAAGPIRQERSHWPRHRTGRRGRRVCALSRSHRSAAAARSRQRPGSRHGRSSAPSERLEPRLPWRQIAPRAGSAGGVRDQSAEGAAAVGDLASGEPRPIRQGPSS